jgi:hypothetical protein
MLFLNRQAELTFLNSARKTSDPRRPVIRSTVTSWHRPTSIRVQRAVTDPGGHPLSWQKSCHIPGNSLQKRWNFPPPNTLFKLPVMTL